MKILDSDFIESEKKMNKLYNRIMTGEQLKDLEDSLWQTADKFRADSGLKAN